MSTNKVNTTQQGVAKLLRGLMHGASVDDLVDFTGLSVGTVRGYLRWLHREGVVRVERYEMDKRNRMSIRVYRIGEGADAKPPKRDRDTREQNSRRMKAYRERLRQQKMLRAMVPAKMAAVEQMQRERC